MKRETGPLIATLHFDCLVMQLQRSVTAEAIARTIWRTLEASQAGILLMGGEPVWVDGEDSDEAVLEEVSP